MKKILLIILIGILAISCVTKKNHNKPYVQMDEIELPRPISVGNAEIQLEIIEYDNAQLSIKVKKFMDTVCLQIDLHLNSNLKYMFMNH